MAGSVNKVILLGNLGADPEVRNAQNGNEIVSLRLATTDTWNDRNTGERQDRTEWHRVVIFNQALTKVAKNYLRKGSKVYLEGELKTRKWTDRDGLEKYTTEVVLNNFRGALVMCDSRNNGGATSANNGGYNSAPSGNNRNNTVQQADADQGGWDASDADNPSEADDIPF